VTLHWEIEHPALFGGPSHVGDIVHALKKRNVVPTPGTDLTATWYVDTAYVTKKGERKWLAFFPTHAQSVNDRMFRTKKAAMAYALVIVQLTQ
jgi:hypothetical protein